jgi:hypothetical protein
MIKKKCHDDVKENRKQRNNEINNKNDNEG